MPLSEKAVPLIGVVTPFLAIAFLAVGLRLHVRVTLLKNSGVDDWLCLGAALCSFGTYLANMTGIVVGFGNPLPSMTPEERDIALKTLWISPPLWGLSSSLVKMSIVTSYLRIWSGKRFKLLCYALICVISMFGLTLFLGGILACVPVSLSWGPPGPASRDPRHCMDLPLFMFATSIPNTAIDLAVLAVPIPLFRKLHIAPKQRAALTAVFTVGVVVCIASIMRLVTLQHVRHTEDPSVSGLPLGIWSGVELDLGIICACLPTLRPMIARAFPRLLGSTADSELSWQGTQRITRDGNGSYRMHELHSNDEDGKSRNGDTETITIRGTSGFPCAPAPLHLDRHSKSYMNFD
ncbi:hypothetical protein F4813DRAFT_232561 [Daldinia decipiens]|uniref:uncharacterized protein n=1 Tax=Daldinia decipiens TaxID=326647 RepID=UPI0020C3116C|nr:uncharacterized protein F4813DRAFT_232561 [Daldinia decipiens]KAI1654050.1 hypothetical protein F4813DRAFT_232561 [Daldinia decipiens]